MIAPVPEALLHRSRRPLDQAPIDRGTVHERSGRRSTSSTPSRTPPRRTASRTAVPCRSGALVQAVGRPRLSAFWSPIVSPRSNSSSVPFSVPRSGRLAGSPAVRRDGKWCLVVGSGSVIATDPAFTGELDRFAALMAAADQSVAVLRTAQGDPLASRSRGRR